MKSRLAAIHCSMKQRCYNENNPNYYRYGGRGISVSNSWIKFKHFKKWALSSGYQNDLTLDRIDNNQGYLPDNCRWANMTVQKLNSGTYKNNTSGQKGVSERNGRFRAEIRYHGKTIYLGTCDTIEEAVLVRKRAEEHYLNLALQGG